MSSIINYYKNLIEEREDKFLFSKAAFSKHHLRKIPEIETDYRLPYKRDSDRIIHSKAYSRYKDKTQVVYLVENDHIAHRHLHVQLVSSFARGIAAVLQLNTDLVEAIALGHDVGHPPFGHEGEAYLSQISMELQGVPFSHPLQSCRLYTEIEPLNLSLAVYDGFLCHDGGMKNCLLEPNYGKTWEIHEKEKEGKGKDPEIDLVPMTLEGCLVKICDTISYLGRDIEDAIQLGLIKREDLPETFLGNTNTQILNEFGKDLIRESFEQEHIAISPKLYEAAAILREFNFKNIYFHPKLKVESEKIERSYRALLELILEDYSKNCENSLIWKDFLKRKNEKYLSTASPIQQAVDYVSGMTDNFFIRTLEKLIIPQRIGLSLC